MNAIRLTKAHQFWPLTDYMSGFGVPIGQYIERFQISKKILEAPELYVDEARFWRLAGDLAKREGFLDWGFRAGQQLDLSVLGEFGTALLRQPSLKVALEAFVMAISAEALNVQFRLMQQGEYTWLIMSGCHDAPSGQEVIELYDLAFMFKLVQNVAGNHWRPPAVHLQCGSLPEGLAEREISSGTIRYSSTMTAIAIPEPLMALPMSQYCSFSATETRIQNRNIPDADFATSLRLLMAGHLDEGLTIGECADLIGMSERTLQRRLAAHETSYNDLQDQTRFDVAKQLLSNHSTGISDICYELGYANPANFTRAFKRWAGVTPRQHRQLFSQPEQ
jgi:AraC-like DNA-binding protein